MSTLKHLQLFRSDFGVYLPLCPLLFPSKPPKSGAPGVPGVVAGVEGIDGISSWSIAGREMGSLRIYICFVIVVLWIDEEDV